MRLKIEELKMQRIGFDNNVLKKKMRPTIFLALLYVPLLCFFAFLFVGFFFLLL